MSNDGGLAFPTVWMHSDTESGDGKGFIHEGMSYRQWLVGQALTGVMTVMASRQFLDVESVHTSLDNMIKVVDLTIEKERATRT